MPSIAVIGGGPAGFAFAVAMADAGRSVELFERSPEIKAAGSGIVLQPTGMTVAGRLGIGDGVERCGHPIDRVVGTTAYSKRRVIDVDYGVLSPQRNATAVHRSTVLDALLKRAADRGVSIQPDIDIRRFENAANGRVRLQCATGQWLGPFDLVVDASGARSTLRAQVFGRSASKTLRFGSLWGTFDRPDGVFTQNTLQQRFARGNGSIGVMPIGSAVIGGRQKVALFWNIECAAYKQWLRSGLPAWKNQVVEIWPECACLMDQIGDSRQLTLARYRHHTTPLSSSPGMVFIGDAARSTSPQMGQGVNMALLDALTLAQALTTEENIHAACRRYVNERRRQVLYVQSLARLLIPFYQADNRIAVALRDAFFQPLSRLTSVRRFIALTVAGLITDPLRYLGPDNVTPLPQQLRYSCTLPPMNKML